jgi:hypothetical protein
MALEVCLYTDTKLSYLQLSANLSYKLLNTSYCLKGVSAPFFLEKNR